MPQKKITIKDPKISIVTPSYNQAQFLEECIDSILSQKYKNFEYIIMDGGSNDGSVEIIKKYEKHLTFWQSKSDGGQYDAVNEGFMKTSGDIMAWLNSDDKYHHDAFFKVAYLFNAFPQIEWLTGRPTFWGKNGELIHIESSIPVYYRNNFLDGKYNQPFIQQESTFWKRSLWDQAGGYLRTDLNYAGDLELWISFFRYAPIHSVDTFLGGYRDHGNQKAHLFIDKYIAEAEKIIEHERKLYPRIQTPTSSDSKTLLEFELKGYKEYLSKHEPLKCSLNYMVSSEEVLQFLLKFCASNLAKSETINKKLVDRIEELHSSLSWRINEALRWLGGRFLNRS